MFRYLNWASILLLVGLSSWIAIRCGVLRSIGKLALLLALALLFPLAIHLIAVLGQNSYTHWIMCYPFVLVYVAMLASADRAEAVFLARFASRTPKRHAMGYLRAATCFVLVISLLLCRQWFFTTNQAYEYIRYQNENTVAKGTMLTNDIQNDSNYKVGSPIALVGSSAPEVFQYNTGDFLVIHGSSGIGYSGYNSAIIDNERLKYLLRNWIGIEFQYVDANTVAALSQNAAVIAMPVYPQQGSIAFVDGVLVVKLSDIQTSPAE